MSGSFGEQNKHSAIKYSFDDGSYVFFNDIRRFGNIKIASRRELQEKLDSLGWDPLQEPEMPNWLLKFFRLKNHKTIVEVMMDQSILNGCGNYIKSDSLYLSKIHPNALVSSLTDDQIIELCANFSAVAHESFAAGGNTIATYADMNGNIGKYNKKVYKKDFDPEGNSVIKIQTKDKRSSYYVDKYQKL
jgi:formamidopyrimidine-DNA glycosylase